jgi:hypothetical protein
MHSMKLGLGLPMRTLSSPLTFIVKVLAPALTTALVVGTVLAASFAGEAWWRAADLPRDPVSWAAFVAWSAFCIACMLWFGLPLKWVRLDDGALQISNYLRQIRVPLSDLAAVSEKRLVRFAGPYRIVLEFRRPTDFGHSIAFLPKALWRTARTPSELWGPHPDAEGLRAAILLSQAAGEGTPKP